MNTINTINTINETINQIRTAINETKDETLLTSDSPLSDYAMAIRQLGTKLVGPKQQLIILYTFAEDAQSANKKAFPSISWPIEVINENGEKTGGEVIIEADEWGWVTTNPKQTVGSSERLHVRFVSIFYGENEVALENRGIPIELQGEKGDKGEPGQDGANALVIGLTQFRFIKLYNTQIEQPKLPDLKFDVDEFVIKNDELSKYLYYINDSGNKIYIRNEESEWKFAIDPGESAWEITIDFRSTKEDVNILSGPLYNTPVITETKFLYCLSETNEPGNTWTEDVYSVSNEKPYLFCKIETTYVTGQKFYSSPILLDVLPLSIVSIETTYGTSSDVSIEPETWDSTAAFGPVIWKKEITTYNRNFDNGNNVHTVVDPIVIQGPAGIQILGTVESVDELPTELTYGSDYIGKIGILVHGETYIWYGTEDPNLGCEKIGDYYWLNIGSFGSGESDWNANEGESGYIKNRTHYAYTVIKSKIIDTTSLVPGAVMELPKELDLHSSKWEGIVTYEDGTTKSWVEANALNHVGATYMNPSKLSVLWNVGWADSVIKIELMWQETEVAPLDPKFCNKIQDVNHYGLCSKINTCELIPGAKYRIIDYPNLYIIVEATSSNLISKYATAIHKESEQSYNIEYSLDNLNNAYILHGEPFTLEYNYPQDGYPSDLWWLIQDSGLNIADYKVGYAPILTFIIKDAVGRTIFSYPNSGQSQSVQDYVLAQIALLSDSIAPIILNDTLIVGIKRDSTWYIGKNSIINPDWYNYAPPLSCESGTILKMEYQDNEIPYDPFLTEIPCNITGKFNKAYPYFDKESNAFIMYPIDVSANNASITIDNSLSETIMDNSKII